MKKEWYWAQGGARCKLSQISKAMRMTFLMMLVVVTHLSARVNGQGNAVTLMLKDVSVEEALEQAERQLGQSFFFNRDKVDLTRRVDLNLKEADLGTLVKELFGEGFKYRVEGNLVIVSPREESAVPQVQEVKITGTVKDKSGNVLPGVTVLVKGTNLGVATDVDGKYKLSMPAGDHTLVFSMIGMKVQEVKVGKRTVVDVVMEEEVSEMDEVVVTGIFNKSKESFTGAVTTITSKELKMFRGAEHVADPAEHRPCLQHRGEQRCGK